MSIVDIVSLIAAVLGILSALIPFFARQVDKRQRRRREIEDEGVASGDLGGVGFGAAGGRRAPAYGTGRPHRRGGDVEDEELRQVRGMVRPVAIVMIVLGILALGLNLVMIAAGISNIYDPPPRAATEEPVDEVSRQIASGMVLFMFACLALASAVATWAGFNMIRLRSYYLSITGAFAIMFGGCPCLLLGVVVGIWALIVLFKPEVNAAFS